MKKLFLLLPFVGLVGCTSILENGNRKSQEINPMTTQSVEPKYPVLVSNYKRPEQLTMDEVIEAVGKCQDNKMKPVVKYVYQTTEFGKLQTPYDVHCEVYRMER